MLSESVFDYKSGRKNETIVRDTARGHRLSGRRVGGFLLGRTNREKLTPQGTKEAKGTGGFS